jgi:hypothetical protein
LAGKGLAPELANSEEYGREKINGTGEYAGAEGYFLGCNCIEQGFTSRDTSKKYLTQKIGRNLKKGGKH